MASKYDKYTEQIKEDYIVNKMTKQEIEQKYGIKSHNFIPKVLGKNLRNRSEVSKLSHNANSASYKMSEETKQKLRIARLNFIKEHPEQTAWRKNNEPSYPEKCFIKFLEQNGYDKKYCIEREYPVFPYYIDFAFVNEKIAIEIDGSQHLESDRAESDRKKDDLLVKNGWKVIRISESEVKTNWESINAVINESLNFDRDLFVTKIGIFKHKKLKNRKQERDEYGRTEKETINCIKQRIVKNRPNKDELYELLVKEKNFSAIGKMFNVSDNAIRKWCKWYKIPSNIKFYKMLGSSN